MSRKDTPSDVLMDTSDYRTPFENWEKEAWARKGPPIKMEFAPGLKYFSPSISPLFTHNLVSSADEDTRDRLLILSLHTYLEFTVRLEMGPVNKVANLLTEPAFLPWLPQAMKEDAFLVYFDESLHAEESKRLAVAVRRETGIDRAPVTPAFLRKLDELIEIEEYELHPLVKLFFVIISETLITGSLSFLPKDKSVQMPVREVTDRHARDESRHHGYFKTVFHFVWPRLPAPVQQLVGILLPEMVWAFLAPDRGAMEAMLNTIELRQTTSQIVENILASARTLATIKKSAAPTLVMFNDAGVLNDKRVREAFRLRGLID
jgi:hypothetical protein